MSVHAGCYTSPKPDTAILDRIGIWNFSDIDVRAQNCTRHFQLQQPFCPLRRFTLDDAYKCLAHKHIVMIGDSLTRHQYTALVLWLALQEETLPFVQDTMDAPNPTPTSSRLPPGADVTGCGTVTKCDIWPRGSPEWADKKKHLSNFYYYNKQHDFNITVFGYYTSTMGHTPVGWTAEDVQYDYEGPLAWGPDNLHGLASVIRRHFGMVDAIQLNVGHWLGNKEFMNSAFLSGPDDRVKSELSDLASVSRQVSRCGPTTQTDHVMI